MNTSINDNRPSQYVTIYMVFFVKIYGFAQDFQKPLLKRTEVSGSGQEEKRLKTNTAMPKQSDIQGQARPSLKSKVWQWRLIICTCNLEKFRPTSSRASLKKEVIKDFPFLM